ncbi:glycoside hydrolase family protein [Aestuariibaculum sp. YM273]|uniref:glycoside hydrolase family protein n=1 Tax=Aestuariibaculum sp. YM273 TaxID=3070659 RepID=UPI0027DAEE3F|nr:glycoside hydrolase family protein [Aestuariibaculum sp. YM273]WMI66201.1 glycoside hydrolase family protein [Aestuariibaculum sp. YM273]
MLKQIRPFIIVIVAFAYTLIGAQNISDDLSLTDYLKPITADNVFKTEGYYNWGTSILKGDDGKYHMFYSRWKKDYGFYGWLTHSEIAHAVSDNPAGPWAYVETALQGPRENRWDAITAHNPKIKYFNGKYYLYYVGTNLGDKTFTEEELIETAHTGYSHPNWKILRPNQRVGVAVSNSVNGPWKRFDKPLIEPSGPITTLTVNPAITKGKDDNYYLIVKGDKPNEKRFIRNQAMAISKSPTGPFEIQEKPVIDYIDTEDMSMWYDEIRDRFYGVFHAEGFIGMVTSADGIHWEKAINYELMAKKVKQADGSLLIPGRLERPFIYQENGSPKVLGLAVKQGDESFSIFIPIDEI